MAEPFHFYTRLNLVMLLHRRACNARELLEGIKEVPLSSIYYHTHHFLQEHHYLVPPPTSDFSLWLTAALGMDDLGEALGSVDTIEFHDLEELRAELVKLIERHLKRRRGGSDCSEGHEFHFMAAKIFVLPTHYKAGTVEEFIECLRFVSIDSIYFHIFEARLRLKLDENDFSRWLKSLGKKELAARIARLDPYSLTREGLRQKIIALGEKHGT